MHRFESAITIIEGGWQGWTHDEHSITLRMYLVITIRSLDSRENIDEQILDEGLLRRRPNLPMPDESIVEVLTLLFSFRGCNTDVVLERGQNLESIGNRLRQHLMSLRKSQKSVSARALRNFFGISDQKESELTIARLNQDSRGRRVFASASPSRTKSRSKVRSSKGGCRGMRCAVSACELPKDID